jgi:hypothetical protein
MSGFVLVFDQKDLLTAQTPDFVDFLESVANYKCLAIPQQFANGTSCVAAKLDSASTLHQGIASDEATGSWLLAVGTVIDSADVHPAGNLQRLLADYLEQGIEVFERLDGHFALVAYDGREESILVVSDPFGFISIFYGQKGNRFFISTSALAVAQAVQSEPSQLGARYFILFGGFWGEMTLWQKVKKVSPATALRLTRNGIEQYTYWSFELDSSIAKLSLNESVDYVIESLSRTMRRGLAREGKVWLSLTGGFDSRTLAAMLQHCDLPFKAYCHGPLDSRDVQIATSISQTMGWEYEYFPLPEDWGCQRPRWLARTLGQTDGHLDVLKRARIIREQTLKAQQYDVSLWGYGGEIYRGYWWKQEFLNLGSTSRVDYDRLLDFRLMPAIDRPVLRDTTTWIGSIREELRTQLMAIGEQHPDWPNTVKLDLIGGHVEPSLSGATISAVLGLQRCISPFDLKENVSCVLSINHKWRTHSRLFRLILERVNPVLAGIETADGGPASPMGPTNLHRFVPYWLGIGKKLIWGVGRNYLGKSLWRKINPGTEGKAYPLAQWRRDTLSDLEVESLLTPAKMCSANLYNPDMLQVLLAEARTNNFRHEGLLSCILTVEMALRSVGASF